MSELGYVVREGDFFRGKKKAEVVTYTTEAYLSEARLAMTLIERWGVVAAEVDGEDSAGRSRLRRMTSDELVNHACEVAGKAMSAFRGRQWLLKLPTLPEADEILKQQEDKNS